MKRSSSVLALIHISLMLAFVGGLTSPAFASRSDRTPSDRSGAPALAPQAVPSAMPDDYPINEDTVLDVPAPGVLVNDTDPDLDLLTAVVVTPPAHGALTLNTDGSFSYAPHTDYSGPDSFTYVADDGGLQSAPAAVSLTVAPVNDAPLASPDSYGFFEDQVLSVSAPGVLGNDPADLDGDPLTAVLVSLPAHGTLSLSAGGGFTYTPSTNYSGSDSFTYLTSDGKAQSAAVTVSLSGTAVNSVPVANDDSVAVNEDGTLVKDALGGVLANDQDQDGDSMTASKVSGPTKGALTLNSDGSYSYTPNTNYNGPDSFTYQAGDGTDQSETATVFITVNPLNDLPLTAGENYTTTEDTALVKQAPGVLSNDSDLDGDPLTASVDDTPDHGVVSLSSSGGFTYTPAKNYAGPDSFTYRVSDGITITSPVSVNLSIAAVNDAPVAVDDAFSVTENTALTVPAKGVLANDTDPENDPLTAAQATMPTNGSLTLNGDGSFTYTPIPQFNGTDSFTYRASDGTASSNQATVTLTVIAVDDKPVTNPDSYNTNEDTVLNIAAPGVLGNDADPEGSALTAVVVASPQHGTLTLNLDGSFSYTPAGNYNGPDSFTYKAKDAGGTESATTTVNINVASVNDTPSNLTLSNTSILENQPAGTPVGTLSATDPDTGDTKTYSFSNGAGSEDNALFQLNGAMLGTNASFDHETKNALKVKIRVTDSAGAFTEQAFTIQVTDVNEAPQALPDDYIYQEDQTLSVPAPGVLTNDPPDPDGDTLTVAVVTGPTHGTLTLNANGSFSYKPNANYNGPDSFTYRSSDGALQSAVVTVTLTGTAVNDAPVAMVDSYNTPEDTKLTVAAPGVLTNDTDVDDTTLTANLVDDVNSGTLILNANGSFEYTPNPDSNGTDFFTYYASDNKLHSETVTVTLNVQSVNDPINANDDSVTTSEDVTLEIRILDNDADSDRVGGGDRFSDFNFNSLKITQPPAHGTTSVDKAKGTITYNPARDYVGTDSFKYEICDKGSPSPVTCDTATVTIDVGGVNDTPVIVDDSAVTDEDTPIIVNVLANDTDPDGFGDLVTSSITVTTQPENGTYQIGPTPGRITYSPDRDYHGIDTLIYQVEDQAGARDTATLTITVNSVNDVPIARGNIYTIDQGEVLSRVAPGVLGNDNDADGDTMRAILETAPLSGTITLNANGSFLYIPDESFAGADSFTYVVSDGEATSDPAHVNITIVDVTEPAVQWMLPVEGGGIYMVGVDGINLEANASDNVAIDFVRFYRWQPISDHPQGGVYIDICLDRTAPFSCILDPGDLTPKDYNQVFVEAYDKAGNRSDRSRILLYKQDNQLVLDESIFLPVVGNQFPDEASSTQ